MKIKFLGTGERTDALEQFHPDRLASRILGMGDMLSLIEKAEQNYDDQEALNLERKLRQATFDLEDFAQQLQQLKKMGPLSQIVEMIPGFSGIKNRMPSQELDEGNVKRVESIIYSMTPEERRRPDIIGGSRRRRIPRLWMSEIHRSWPCNWSDRPVPGPALCSHSARDQEIPWK